jgi:membrane associated rhomboid family serine protease
MPLPLYPDLPFSRQPWATILLICFMLVIVIWSLINEEQNTSLAWPAAIRATTELELKIPGDKPFDTEEYYTLDEWIADLGYLRYAYPYEDTLSDDDKELTKENVGELYFSDFDEWSLEQQEAFWEKFDLAIQMVAERLEDEGKFSVYGAMIEHTDHFNPIRWVSTSLIHADFWHYFWNMLFFFAFGAIAEIIINSTSRYLLLLTQIALAVGAADWLMALGGEGYYTLGFSGVVMGAIGVTAYLAPKAKVRSLQLFGFIGGVFSLPVWFLAALFIGEEIYTWLTADDFYGVNVFAHVAGGITGYLIAMYTLEDRKEDIQEELADAIELRRAQRADMLGNLSSAVVDMRKNLGEDLARQDQRGFERDMAQLYRYVETRQYPKGNIALLDIVEKYTVMNLDRLVDLFDRIKLWQPTPVSLNLARLVINSALANQRPDKAIEIYKWAVNITPNFVLADPVNVPLLARELILRNQETLCRNLVKDFEYRYFGYGDIATVRRIELQVSRETL